MVSILNGLSAAGAGISAFAGTAGLEAQKADLANQSAILADKLATTRESTLQGQQQQFLAGQQTSSQTFQAGQNTQEQAAQATRQQAALAVTQAEGAATRAAEAARQKALLDQPPEIIRTLRALGALPPAGAPTDSAAPSPTDAGTGTPSTDTDVPFDTGQATTAPAASTTAITPSTSGGSVTPPVGGVAPNLAESLVNKTLGLPQPGSEDAIRRAIAQDVKTDPQFKYKSAGQQGAEVENRLAIAQGKMTDPASRTQMAQAIASYQMAPLSGFAAAKPGGPETMAQVLKFNPDYQETRYPEVSKAMAAFGSGAQGDKVRFLNVGVQHLDGFDQAAAALGNGDVQALNSMKNWFQQQFGVSAPTTFDGLKQIVGTEIEKAVAGGIGSSADRDRLMAALNRANSPAQLQDMTNGFRNLMAGQLVGLKTQYEDATGFKSGPFAFENKLVPATIKALSGNSGATHAAQAAVAPASAGQQLSVDANGVPSMAPWTPPPAPAANPALMRLWGQ